MDEKDPFAGITPYVPPEASTPPQMAVDPFAGITPYVPQAQGGASAVKALPSALPTFGAMPEAVKPKTLEGYGKNLAQEGGEMAKGAAVLGTLADLRFMESRTPKALLEPKVAAKMLKSPGDFVNGLTPKGAIQSGDLETAGKALKGIVEHYDHYVAKPIMTGHPEKLLDYAYEKPISFASDVIPMAGAMGKVGKFATKLPITGKLANMASKALEASPIVGKIIKQNKVIEALRGLNREFIAKIMPTLHEMEALYNAIPKHLQGRVIEAGEIRSVATAMELRQNPAVRSFLQKANEIDDLISQELIAKGAFTAEQHKLAKFGPYAKARGFLEEGMVVDGNITPEAMQALDAAEAELQGYASLGLGLENPNYFGIIFQKEVDQVKALRGGIFNGKNLSRGNPNEIEQSWQKTREGMAGAGTRDRPGISENAFDTFQTRYLQGMAYLNYDALFEQLLAHPDLLAGTGSSGVLAADAFEKMIQAAGYPKAAADAFNATVLKGQRMIQMPKEAAQLMNDILGVGEVKLDIFDKATNLFKSATLGFDIWWANFQGLQNQMLMPFAMFNSLHPREIARSVMAYAAGLDKRFHKLIEGYTSDIIGEVTSNSMKAHIEKHAAAIEDALTALEDKTGKTIGKHIPSLTKAVSYIAATVSKFHESVFATASKWDNFARATKFAHGLSAEIEAAEPASRLALTEAMNYMKQFAQYEKAIQNPTYNLKAAKEVYRWFGKYDALTAAQWAGMRKLFPFWLWWMHSYSIAWALPAKAPLRAALLQKLMRVAPDQLQTKDMPEDLKQMGALPIWNSDGTRAMTSDGKKAVRYGAGANPNMQPIEHAQQMAHLLDDDSTDREGLPVMNLKFTVPFMIAGINPQTLRTYVNPHHYKVAGNDVNEKGKNIPINHLPWANIPYRALMPKQEANTREIIAGMQGFKPSDMTTLLTNHGTIDVAAKTDKITGKAKADPLPVILMLQLLKSKKSAQETDAGQQEVYDAKNQKNATRAAGRQWWVDTKDQPLW